MFILTVFFIVLAVSSWPEHTILKFPKKVIRIKIFHRKFNLGLQIAVITLNDIYLQHFIENFSATAEPMIVQK